MVRIKPKKTDVEKIVNLMVNDNRITGVGYPNFGGLIGLICDNLNDAKTVRNDIKALTGEYRNIEKTRVENGSLVEVLEKW